MNQNDVSNEFGLSNVTSKFYLENEYFICDKESSKIQFSMFAKYIVFPIDKSNQSLLEWNRFNLLQQSVAAPLFFQFRNDIRWNIYLVFLLMDTVDLSQVDKYPIENDENYARKHILLLSESSQFFLQQQIFINKDPNNKLSKNFIEDWNDALLDVGLSGCMYNSFSQEHIRKYVEEGTPIRPVGRPTSNKANYNSKDSYSVKKIKTISTSDFRAFCLGDNLTLKPGKVNLFSGSNGSGKTSICEAIEYALTGEIRRNLGLAEQGFVKLAVENNNADEVDYSSNIDIKRKKKLDNAWYGTVSTSLSRKSELSNNFSIFNHLDSKSAFELFDSKEKDIQKTIKSIVVGEDIIECEKNIDRFCKEFIVAEKNTKKEIDSLTREIDQIEKELSKSETSDFEDSREYLLKNISALYADFENNKSISNINEQYMELSQVTGSVDQLEKYTSNCSHDISYDDLSLVKNDILFSLDVLNKKINSINVEKSKYAELILQINEIDQNTITLKTEVQFLENSKKKYNELLLRSESLSYSSLLSFSEDYSNKSMEFQILNQILPADLVDNVSILDDFDLNAHVNLIAKKEEYIVLQNQLKLLNDQYSQEVTNSELKLVLLSQLIDLVAEGNESSCPLCGVNHNTHDQLRISMETATRTLKANQDLKDLKMKVEEIGFKLKKCEIIIHNLTEKEKNTAFIMDIYNKIIESSILNNDKDELSTIQHSLTQLGSLKVFINHSEDLDQQIDVLIHSDIFYDFNETMYDDFHIYCVQEINERETNLEELRKTKEIKLSKIKQIPADLENTNKEILIAISEKQKSLESINAVFSSIASIEQIFGRFYQISSIYEWLKKYRNMSYLLEKLKLHDELIRTNSSLFDRKKDKIDLLEKYLASRHNCQIAINAISSLPKTDDYLKGFLNENAQKIERIFGSIHRPKEFSDLQIENGYVTFIRSTGSERIVSNQMSTGQSVALAISLILCLYTSSSNAPQVLIFDEPIANMDDLHMMNFIDILRETAISGTQIFVTTANDNVAGLIRRKFSFFGKDFKHFNFERGDATPATIMQIDYDPNKENLNEIIVTA